MQYKKPKYGHGRGSNMNPSHCFDPHKHAQITWSGQLPHWTQENVMQFVTFRLADSLPQSKLKEFEIEKQEWLENHSKPYSVDELMEYQELFDKKDEWLDAGYGECLLSIAEIQDIVVCAFDHYDGERYELFDYVIMPNHIHFLIIPGTGYELGKIMKGIKGYTAREINKFLQRKGRVWEKEYWDRMIRSVEDYKSKKEYIKNNPSYKK